MAETQGAACTVCGRRTIRITSDHFYADFCEHCSRWDLVIRRPVTLLSKDAADDPDRPRRRLR